MQGFEETGRRINRRFHRIRTWLIHFQLIFASSFTGHLSASLRQTAAAHILEMGEIRWRWIPAKRRASQLATSAGKLKDFFPKNWIFTLIISFRTWSDIPIADCWFHTADCWAFKKLFTTKFPYWVYHSVMISTTIWRDRVTKVTPSNLTGIK